MKKYMALILTLVLTLALLLTGCGDKDSDSDDRDDRDRDSVTQSVASNAQVAALKAEIKNAYSSFVADTALKGEMYGAMEDYYFYDGDQFYFYAYETDGRLVAYEDARLISGVSLGDYNGYTIYEIENTVIDFEAETILESASKPTFKNPFDSPNNAANQAATKAEIKNAYCAFVADIALDGEMYGAIEDYYFYDGDQCFAYDPNGELVVYKEVSVISGVSLGKYNGYTIYEIENTILG